MPDAPYFVPRDPVHGRTWRNAGTLISADMPSAPTILVVENQASVLSLTCSTLQAGGYATLEAVDGLTAWQMLATHRDRIHCLAIDFLLPDLNGGAIVELAREFWPHLPVLLISSQPHAQVTSLFPLLKDLSFLKKPFHDDDLLAIIQILAPLHA